MSPETTSHIEGLYSGERSRWAGDFLREPADFPNRVDAAYLANQSSAAKFFLEWFLQEDAIPYSRMLQQMHRISACGPNGGKYYNIPTSNGGFLKPSADSTDDRIVYPASIPALTRITYPGKLRCELESENIAHATRDIIDFSPGDIDLLRSATEKNGFSGQGASQTEISPLDAVPHTTFDIAFARCALKWPISRASRTRFVRAAPRSKGRDLLLSACAQSLSVCKRWFAERRRRLLLEELIVYYHQAINLMPFGNINNSLLMNQLNAIRRLLGAKPLPHGKLDSFALVLSHRPFRRLVMLLHPEQEAISV